MTSVFKRKGRRIWYYKVQCADGRWRSYAGYTDKRATAAKAAQEQEKIDRGEVGILDPHTEAKSVPLAKLIAAYIQSMAARGRAARHIQKTEQRLATMLRLTKASVVADLTYPRIEKALASLMAGEIATRPGRRPHGVSMVTRDRYVESLRAFGNWLVDTDRLGSNPWRRLKNEARESDRRLEHRALTQDELQQLVAASESRPLQQWAKNHRGASEATAAKLRRIGFTRATVYLFAAYTGMRVSECRAVRHSDLVLDGDEPHVIVRAGSAKNRREQVVPLVSVLVERLREQFRLDRESGDRSRLPDPKRRALHVADQILTQLRKDAEWAGIGTFDGQGRKLTFHGFRASTATLLVRSGVSAATTMRVMRHSDPRLTLKIYAKLGLADMHRELREKMAPPVAPQTAPGDAEARRAVPETSSTRKKG